MNNNNNNNNSNNNNNNNIYLFIYLFSKENSKGCDRMYRLSGVAEKHAVIWDNVIGSRCTWTTECNIKNHETLY